MGQTANLVGTLFHLIPAFNHAFAFKRVSAKIKKLRIKIIIVAMETVVFPLCVQWRKERSSLGLIGSPGTHWPAGVNFAPGFSVREESICAGSKWQFLAARISFTAGERDGSLSSIQLLLSVPFLFVAHLN